MLSVASSFCSTEIELSSTSVESKALNVYAVKVVLGCYCSKSEC
nr:MAG TPA: hypothetical protein [Caudoviricetes sp.]